MSGISAYPLRWPEGWERSKTQKRAIFKQSGEKAYRFLVEEIGRMGGTAVVISSNVPLTSQNKPRMDREPVDSGVAAYFMRNGKQVVFACDRFDLFRDNLTAIGKTISALRGLERWGASDMMERAFSGFKALGTGTVEPWWEVLNCEESATIAEIESQFKKIARVVHPDSRTGTAAEFQRVSDARRRGVDAKLTL